MIAMPSWARNPVCSTCAHWSKSDSLCRANHQMVDPPLCLDYSRLPDAVVERAVDQWGEPVESKA